MADEQLKCLEVKLEITDKKESFQQLVIAKCMGKKFKNDLGELRKKKTPHDISLKEDKDIPILLDELSKLSNQEIIDSDEEQNENSENQANHSFLKIQYCTASKETDPQVRSDRDVPTITGCCWLPDNHGVILCDNNGWNKTIKLLDKDMNVKYTVPCSSSPFDVECIDDISAVVTLPDTKEIQFITFKPGLMFEEKKNMKLRCKGVDVHDEHIFLCVEESSSVKGVKVTTIYGDDVRFIPHLGPGYPRNMCLHSDGKIYYTSGSGNELRVNCLTQNGHILFSVSSNDLENLIGIIADQEGNTLVCDANKKCVRVISA